MYNEIYTGNIQTDKLTANNSVYAGDLTVNSYITSDNLTVGSDINYTIGDFTTAISNPTDTGAVSGYYDPYSTPTLQVQGEAHFYHPPKIRNVANIADFEFENIRFVGMPCNARTGAELNPWDRQPQPSIVENWDQSDAFTPSISIDLPYLKKALMTTKTETYSDNSMNLDDIEFPVAAKVNLADVLNYFVQSSTPEAFEEFMADAFERAAKTKPDSVRRLSNVIEKLAVENSITELVD